MDFAVRIRPTVAGDCSPAIYLAHLLTDFIFQKGSKECLHVYVQLSILVRFCTTSRKCV